MRPHRLEITAFGPFARHVDVDFDRLGRGGLFLMHGETGAGKTSVLDALSFALYGQVAGERGVRRLRSDHAAPELRTEVRLEMSVGGRRMRVIRTPAQQRPKARGTGLTTEPASVALDEWDESLQAEGDAAVERPAGGWRRRSSRVGEVDQELSDLLGMSAAQFHQVVLLPQGKFAQFLHSDAAGRTELLQRLFGTDRFHKIEDWLADQRRQSRDSCDQAREITGRLVARVAQAAGIVEAPALPDADWAGSILQSAHERAEQTQTEADAARLAAETARVAESAARDLQRRQARRAEALAERAALEADASVIAEAAALVKDARRAIAVRPFLEAAVARAAEHARATETLRRALDGRTGDLDEPDDDHLVALVAADRERLGRLAEAQEVEKLVAAAVAEEQAAHTSGAAASARLSEAGRRRDALATARAAAVRRLAAAQQAVERLPDLRRRCEAVAEAGTVAAALVAAQTEHVRLVGAHLSAREESVARRSQYNALQSERIDSMIAELASRLVDDTPCPVCGSIDHPDPSEVRGRPVSREDEQEAQAIADRANEVAAQLGQRVAAGEARLLGMRERLTELGFADVDPAAITQEGAAATAAARAAEQAADDRLPAEVALGELDEQLREVQAKASRAEGDQAAALEQQTAAGGRRRELVERLQGMLDGASTVEQARAAALDRIRLAEAARSALVAQAATHSERLVAETALTAAVSDAGFGGPEQARAALLEPARVTALQRQVEQAQQQAAAVEGRLADPDLAVELTPPAPVEQTGGLRRSAETTAREADRTAATARHRVEQLTALAEQLSQQLAALAPIEQRAQEVKALADLAAGTGANQLNMTLSAYVLAARLEEVAEAASHRLRAMTQGRYALVHTDVASGNGRSGLRLLVSDAWTGQDRDTSTLSGGETFLASLALALGLAEVVTAAAAGAPLEALFVDEGFGTLDEETLNEALEVLDGLREGGRLVGIVSHVPGLRERIPSQLRVHKGTAGSRVEIVETTVSGEPTPGAGSRPRRGSVVRRAAAPAAAGPEPDVLFGDVPLSIDLETVPTGGPDDGAAGSDPAAARPARTPRARSPRAVKPEPEGQQLALLGTD